MGIASRRNNPERCRGRPLHRKSILPESAWCFFIAPSSFPSVCAPIASKPSAKMDLRTTGMEIRLRDGDQSPTLLKLRIAEVPTTLSPGRSRPPHLRPVAGRLRHLRSCCCAVPRWCFCIPGLLMIAVGLGVGSWLCPAARSFRLVLDVHTCFYAAYAVIVGFQAVAFALFARVFAVREGVLPRRPALGMGLKSSNLDLGVVTWTGPRRQRHRRIGRHGC